MYKRLLSIILAAVIPVIVSAGPKVIRILAIGNSFSEDSIEQNLHMMALSSGTPMIIANLYIGGCTIDRHYGNICDDKHDYRYTKFDVNGNKTVTKHVALSEVIGEEPWDYISIQQSSGNSGFPETYAHLGDIVDWLHAHSPSAEVVFHQTWAYSKDSSHKHFPRYDSDQQKMYDAICRTVAEQTAKVGIRKIIPTGVAIQTLRNMTSNYDLTRDGYHLSYGLGRYTAACTWFEALSGRNVVGMKYFPDGSDPRTQPITAKEARLAQKAAHKACAAARKNSKLQ